ncbi:MAG: universal stress protein [Burkholderiaceae bacterium]
MTYKTILTHVDSFQPSTAHIEFAAELASTHESHLIGLCPSGFASLPAGDYFGASARYVGEMQQELDDAAVEASKVFEAQCKKTGISSYESRVTTDSVISATLLGAVFADLIVVSQPAEDAAKTIAGPGFVGDLLMDSRRPVLVLPNNGALKPVAGKAVVAWNGSREAARAVTDAMPLLARAAEVEVIVVNSREQGAGDNELPGAELGLFLARHGIKVVVRDVVANTSVSDAILNEVEAANADLLVMGGYGHSRIREWVLGGTTREILAATGVPVLMSH